MATSGEKPHYHDHRKRLRARVLERGADGLADYELLEYLLFGAQGRGDVKPIAKRLIERFGSLAGVFAAPVSELVKVDGVKDATAAMLAVTAESNRRAVREHIASGPVLGSWSKLIDYLRVSMGHAPVEEFRILFLDAKNGLIADETQNRGTVNHTAVYPREVIRRALELGAVAIIVVHNHPSGDATPSRADIDMTKRIRDAGEMMGITLHDHVVIARSGHESFRAMGLL